MSGYIKFFGEGTDPERTKLKKICPTIIPTKCNSEVDTQKIQDA